jgi:beta-hydroxyacyl-ACP dehydratase FabZ
VLDISEIKKRLKHRYPMLLIDRIIELEEGVSCTAVKNISINEPIFTGHFEEKPIFPGMLIMEALAQTAGIAGYSVYKEPENELAYFVGLDKVRFKKPVVPGDQLLLKSVFMKKKLNIWVLKGEAFVNDELVAEGEFKLAIVPIEKT